MTETVYLLGTKIDLLKKKDFFHKLNELLKANKPHQLVTLNPEMLVDAQTDQDFRKIINKADLVVPDGIGVLKALKYLRIAKEHYPRVTGTDLIYEISKRKQGKEKIFLFGSQKEVVEKTSNNLKEKFPKLEIVGKESGYNFSDQTLIEKINKSQATILLVALGHPKQEKWIFKHLKDFTSVKIAIGVGGAFDFISGKVKRAPYFLRKSGLEWLWRLITQPWRLKRVFKATVIFPLKIFLNCKKNN